MGRSRKRTKINNNSNLDTKNRNTDPIPTDIVNEILHRLPSKSIAKFIRVSKSWAKIIHSNYFINSFSLQQSMEQQPHNRLLFAIKSQENWSFFTNNENSPLEFKFISRMASQSEDHLYHPNYLKGLLSFVFGTTQVISNPSTGKSIVLPIVKSRRKILRRYFGFDPIKSEYKVLCIVEPMYGHGNRIPPSQNQVLTLEFDSIWREIDILSFHHPHRPHYSKGVCINGVIYYLAYEAVDRLVLVRFDVNSEKFLNPLSCLFLQIFGRVRFVTLINYKSKLAITCQENLYSIDLWVLKDVKKQEWVKIYLNVFPLRSFLSRFSIEILGTNPRGEMIYTCYDDKDSFYVIYHHDHKKHKHTRLHYKAKKGNIYRSFIDYEESVMLL